MIRKHAPPIILLLAVSVLFTVGHRAWEAPEYPGSVHLDAPKMFYPLRHWTFAQVAKGTVPYWNPMILCGTPNVAELQSAVFYPPNLVFALMDTANAYCVSVALHLFMAGAFCYALLIYYGKSIHAGLFAGLTYMLCGPQVTHLWAGHLTVLCVVAWVPLLILFFDKAVRQVDIQAGVGASLVLCLQLLAGYPQSVLYALHSATFLGLCIAVSRFRTERCRRRLLSRLGLMTSAVVTGFSLAAVQLLPAMEFVPLSVRSNSDYYWPGTHGLPPENLFSYFVPEFFNYWGREPYIWETCAYVGLLPLFLSVVAVVSRAGMTRVFLAIFVLSVLLATAAYTPFYHVAYYGVPGFSIFRGHAKYLLNAALALSVLGGSGLDAFAALSLSQRRLLLRGSTFVCGLLLLPYVAGKLNASVEAFFLTRLADLVGALSPGITTPGIPADYALDGIGMSGIVLLVICGWQWVWHRRDTQADPATRTGQLPHWSLRIAFVILLADLSMTGWKYFSMTPAVPHGTVDEMIQHGRRNSQSVVLANANILALHHVNGAMLGPEPTSEGYVGNAIAAYSQFFWWSEGEPIGKTDFTFKRKAGRSGATRFFGESNSVLRRAFFLPDRRTPDKIAATVPLGLGLPDIPSLVPISLFETSQAISYLNSQRSVFQPDISDYGNNEVRIDARPTDRVFLEIGITNEDTPTASKSVAPPIDQAAGYLVITDTFYPGWHVYVDGKKRECLRMYVTFRGVYLHENERDVEFLYEPQSIRIGLFISLVSLALVVATLAVIRWK